MCYINKSMTKSKKKRKMVHKVSIHSKNNNQNQEKCQILLYVNEFCLSHKIKALFS